MGPVFWFISITQSLAGAVYNLVALKSMRVGTIYKLDILRTQKSHDPPSFQPRASVCEWVGQCRSSVHCKGKIPCDLVATHDPNSDFCHMVIEWCRRGCATGGR
jgi:hypothetical protein